MPRYLSADFNTRRDAEMAVEHIVQEHGIDRNAVTIVAASPDNSAGTQLAGSDIENTGDKAGAASNPALRGQIRVSVEAEDAVTDKVLTSFATYNGRQVD